MFFLDFHLDVFTRKSMFQNRRWTVFIGCSQVAWISYDKGGGTKKVIAQAKEVVKHNGFINVDYQLRYHFGINPEELSDEEWAIAIAALEKIRKEESGEKRK